MGRRHMERHGPGGKLVSLFFFSGTMLQGVVVLTTSTDREVGSDNEVRHTCTVSLESSAMKG